MSFTRLYYDDCNYKKNLKEWTQPGNYVFEKPVMCEPCYPYTPSIRLQRKGNSTINPYLMDTDLESELRNITRPATKCPSVLYNPVCHDCECERGEICGQGVTHCNRTSRSGERCDSIEDQLTEWPDCFIPPESTRLSNPPCTLRGTGWNRWEWLCQNPQDRIEIPFDFNINNRIISKDNHRPLIPNPIDQTQVLPKGYNVPLNLQYTQNTIEAPTFPPSVHWQDCQVYNKY